VQRITLFTSLPLLAELSDVLSRPKFGRKVAASRMSVDQLVDSYADLSNLVRPVAVQGIAPDPDDDVVIGTALAAQADLLVTGDHALLTVGRHHDVRMVNVADALAAIGQPSE
jgi:putative PIN family toxin of toxin-antitoxin system